MYDAGQTIVYRAPPQWAIYTASWVWGGGCFLITAGTISSLHAMKDQLQELAWFVPVAYQLVIVVSVVMGGFFLLRPINFIKKIDLVNMDGLVKMGIQVARPLPFLRPRVMLIAPHEFVQEKRFVPPMRDSDFLRDPQEDEGEPSTGFAARILNGISKAIYYPFAATQKALTLDGFMHVTLGQEELKAKLDTHGKFSNNGYDLPHLGVVKR
jgi:hypothetical protein